MADDHGRRKGPGPMVVTIELDAGLVTALRPEAARRGVTVPRLARDLLDTIATDRLVRAVLDTD
jgi:hypothetical protein